MAAPLDFGLLSTHIGLRFIQGYRYLDRCGECLVRLEDALHSGWIPSEASPTSGTMKNEELGMSLGFNSEGMNIRQSEFMHFDMFADQSCRIYETLWRTLGIDRITTPGLRLVYQKGFDENEDEKAEHYLLKMGLCTPNGSLLKAMGGATAALNFTLVTHEKAQHNDSPIERRRRLEASVVKQAKQPSFDKRLLQRSRALGPKQTDAIKAFMRLRKLHPEISPVAVQFDIEDALDMDLLTKEFNMPDFIAQSKKWAESLLNSIVRLGRS